MNAQSNIRDLAARGVTRSDDGTGVVVSFVDAAEVVRFRLSFDDAAFLAGALVDQIGCRSHSPRSSDSPTLDVSTPFDGVKV